MSRKLLAASFAAISCLSVPALAQSNAAAAVAKDAPRLAAAGKLLEAMHYDSMMARTVDSLIKQMQKDIPAEVNAGLDQPLPPEVIAKLQTLVDVHFRKAVADHGADMKRATMLIYAEHFTAAELERLAQIQADPVMIKSQAEMPEIAAESLNLGRGLVADELPKIRSEAQALILDELNKDKKPGT